jgi:ribosomal protein S18 acetylase RimI-like enzyme
MSDNRIHSYYEISPNCSQEDISYLWNGITQYNFTIGPLSNYPVYEPFRLIIRDEKSVVLAGILTHIYLNSMHVELLWVHQSYRKMGLGSRLLSEAEVAAINKGCTFISLDTFSFQAIDFYRKHQYEVFAVLDDFPDNIKQYYLKKRLGAN